MDFTFPYKTKETEVIVAGRPIRVLCLENLDATIDELFIQYEKDQKTIYFEEYCPYFGVLWPAGKALAHYVAGELKNWKEEKILELGCGLALPSLLLGQAGVPVLASDWHPDAAEFLRRNILLNGIETITIHTGNWEALEGSYTRTIASDILYDASQVGTLLCFLRKNLRNGHEFIMADPGRPYLEKFHGDARKEFQVNEWLYEGIFFTKITI